MGVMCDLVKDEVKVQWLRPLEPSLTQMAVTVGQSTEAASMSFGRRHCTGFPPDEVNALVNAPVASSTDDGPTVSWRIKLPLGHPIRERADQTVVLFSRLNDSLRLSFAEIADLIEQFIPEDPDDPAVVQSASDETVKPVDSDKTDASA